jgi:hypothetical protein
LEVGYRLNGTTLERAEVNELDSEWNPYGDRDSADHQYGYQPVVDRVIAFRFICYDDRMVAYVPEQDSSSPAMVGLALTLLDTKSFARWQQLSEPQKSIYASQQARTFRKTVQIPTQQLTQE